MINNKFCKTTILIVYLFLFTGLLYSQPIAFPGAEGYGKYATGGRGGKVIEVTNLNASGAGSFAAAIGASGPRTVVFRVSGTITGSFSIKNDNITIAGQTAPGDGICIRGNLSTSADNIIIRYIRVRYDPSMGENDALGGRYQKNIIFDHVSASWSSDEVLTLYHNENTTVQWCIISEGCEKYGEGHRFGGIWGNDYGTWHHNLLAHNDSRNPRWAGGTGYNDYRNNVLYNWGYNSCYGGEAQQRGSSQYIFSTINIVANYYKPGPATGPKDRIAQPSAGSASDKGSWYVDNNYVNGYPSVTADNWKGIDGSSYIKLSAPWPAMAINQQTAEEAYQSVLDQAGCSLPARDAVDTRIMDEVRTGTANYGNNGIIDVPSDVGGWPVLQSAPAPTDTDHDGMPDDWEIANGLNKDIPDDRNDTIDGGYTNLEVYLNSITEFPAFLYFPTNVTTELKDLTEVEITWDVISEDETGFRIERAKGDTGIFDSIATVQTGVTSFVDTVLEELTLYRYRVLAFNDSLTSWYEQTVPVTTLGSASLPAAVSDPSPGNNTYNIGTDTTVMWKASINADSYDVYFGTENPPPFVMNQEGTTYQPDELAKGTRYYWRIDGKNSNGTTEGLIWRFKVEGTLSSIEETVSDKSISVRNYPNPFSSFTTINYELKSQSEVKLCVYNVMGENVATLVNQWQSAGEHSVTFDAGNLESGVYIFSLKTGLSEQRGKMLLMK